MKAILKILKWGLILIGILAIALVSYVSISYEKTFDVPYPDIQASTDPEVIAHGKYLALGPAHCAHCHAPLSELVSVDQGKEVPLSGGFNFYLPIGTLYTPNITSDKETGIGNLTDQEIARSLRYGVRHDGQAILDLMPFYDLSDEDLTAIISWLRTQPAVKNERPRHEYNFLGKVVKTFALQPMGDSEIPDAPTPGPTTEYGKYLVNSVANCRGCHSKRDLMTGAYTGPELAGGLQFEVMNENGEIIPGKHLVTPNLTPHTETGVMAEWSQADFIQRMRAGRVIQGSPMPWGPFSRMSEDDLVAIYKYLNSMEPVEMYTPLGVQEGDPDTGA